MPLTFFTVSGQYRPVTADRDTDADYNPQTDEPITATVTFTPVLETGDVILATQEATIFVPAPIQAMIDTDGVLKLRAAPDPGGAGTFAPVRLLADTPLLGLATPLFYDVKFGAVTFAGRPWVINGFRFQAPNADTVVNLVTVSKVPGQPATGIVKLAPGGVRMVGTDLVFSFGGTDIPDPVSMAHVQGPPGPAGPQGLQGAAGVGTQGIQGVPGTAGATGPAGPAGAKGDPGAGLSITGTVPTYGDLPPGLGAGNAGVAYFCQADGLLYVWTGTAWPAQGNGAQFKGDKGDKGDPGAPSTVPGPQGPQGAQGAKGDTGAASTVPGPQGAQGPEGPAGPKGDTGAASTVPGPKGDTGASGAQGPQGPAGAASTVAGPKGDTGPQGPQGLQGAAGAASTVAGPQGPAGSTGLQGPQGPAGSAGAQGPQGVQGPAGPTRADLVLGSSNGTATGLTLWVGTAAQYAAVAKVATTVYVVT
jgi:hypothetical protein